MPFLVFQQFQFRRTTRRLPSSNAILILSLFKLTYDKIMQNGFDSDCEEDIDDDILLNDFVANDFCADAPPQRNNCGVFTSVHADKEIVNVDIDFISEQLVDNLRVKRSICISDTGIPNNWDDKHWIDGNNVLKPILPWKENAGLNV